LQRRGRRGWNTRIQQRETKGDLRIACGARRDLSEPTVAEEPQQPTEEIVVPEVEMPTVVEEPQIVAEAQLWPEEAPQQPIEGEHAPVTEETPEVIVSETEMEPDMTGEEVDDDYFAALATPEPAPIPKPLGVETGIIGDDQITVSTTSDSEHTVVESRGSSKTSWQPELTDSSPTITIDLGKVMEVHGLGTKGDASQPAWVTKYTVYTSEDGVDYKPLLNTHTNKPRVFIANSDQDTWKNHCLHRYYGCAPKTRFVQFRPLESNGPVAMRVELYGFRDADDSALLEVLKKDVWTRATTGCQCAFNPSRFDCACCMEGASQCPCSNGHQCVKSGTQATKCGIPELRAETQIQDPWTITHTGELCQFDTARGNACAKCAVGGCQCARNPNQCVECGNMEACGKKESVFGPNAYCDVTETCMARILSGGN
jgi:hypothetical protein